MSVGDGSFAIGSTVWPGASKLLEEMGELQQVLGKLIAVAGADQHWDGDLVPRIVDEVADVYAALDLFKELNLSEIGKAELLERRWRKVQLFFEWHRSGDPRPGPED